MVSAITSGFNIYCVQTWPSIVGEISVFISMIASLRIQLSEKEAFFFNSPMHIPYLEFCLHEIYVQYAYLLNECINK